jgi:hypothetical protein
MSLIGPVSNINNIHSIYDKITISNKNDPLHPSSYRRYHPYPYRHIHQNSLKNKYINQLDKSNTMNSSIDNKIQNTMNLNINEKVGHHVAKKFLLKNHQIDTYRS